MAQLSRQQNEQANKTLGDKKVDVCVFLLITHPASRGPLAKKPSSSSYFKSTLSLYTINYLLSNLKMINAFKCFNPGFQISSTCLNCLVFII